MKYSSITLEDLFKFIYQDGDIWIYFGNGQLHMRFCHLDTLVREIREVQAKVNELFPQFTSEELAALENIPFDDEPDDEEEDDL